jgi:hypothetical protein
MSSDRFIPQQKFETPLTFDRAPDPPAWVPRVAMVTMSLAVRATPRRWVAT